MNLDVGSFISCDPWGLSFGLPIGAASLSFSTDVRIRSASAGLKVGGGNKVAVASTETNKCWRGSSFMFNTGSIGAGFRAHCCLQPGAGAGCFNVLSGPKRGMRAEYSISGIYFCPVQCRALPCPIRPSIWYSLNLWNIRIDYCRLASFEVRTLDRRLVAWRLV